MNDITGDLEPMDNIWNDAPNGPGSVTDRVTGTGNGAGFNWLFQPGISGANIFDPLDNATISPIIATVPDLSNGVFCNDYTNRQQRDIKFGAIVGDSLVFNEFENENIYLSKSLAYQEMKADSTILLYGTIEDFDYQNFYNAIEATNIGLFDSVSTLAADSNTMTMALTTNAIINDTNTIEYYQKTVNDILLNQILTGNILTKSDSLILNNISLLPVTVGGEAVYIAPAILGLEIHPQFVSLRLSNPGGYDSDFVIPARLKIIS